MSKTKQKIFVLFSTYLYSVIIVYYSNFKIIGLFFNRSFYVDPVLGHAGKKKKERNQPKNSQLPKIS